MSQNRSTGRGQRLIRTRVAGLAAVGLAAVSVVNRADDALPAAQTVAGDEIIVAGVNALAQPRDLAPARVVGELEGLDAMRVAELSDALGVGTGSDVDAESVQRVAEALDYRVTDDVEQIDVDELVAVYRQRLIPAMERLDVSLGDRADVEDVAASAELLEVEIRNPESPTAVQKVLQAARAAADAPLEVSEDVTPVFASIGDVELHVPSDALELVGFHEAAGAGTHQLQPQENVEMMTLPTRNRGTRDRSAVDVAVQPDTPALSPVSGIVVSVDNYQLYGQHPDVRIAIIPDADPSKVVAVLHVTGPTVAVGDRVEAGVTQIAERSTLLPFASQIDRFAGTLPHIHIEVLGNDQQATRPYEEPATSGN